MQTGGMTKMGYIWILEEALQRIATDPTLSLDDCRSLAASMRRNDKKWGNDPVRRMTAKANGATYAQFISAGWSPDQMRAAGYLLF